MKLFVLALVILLIIVVLEVTNFYKEGLDVFSVDSLLTDSTSQSLKNDINYGAHTKFDNSKNMKRYNPKIQGGSIIGINDEVIPYSHSEDTAIIDPDAADLEAAKTVDEDVEISERQLWYGTDATLKNNFEQATLVSPMFKVGVISTKEDELYDNVVKACSDNTFNMGANPGKGKEYLYGWSASANPSFPCVGFYSHKGSKNMKDGNVVKKYSILVDCQNNNCDEIGLKDTPGGDMYPSALNVDVDEVFKQKSTNEQGRSLKSALGSLTSFYEETTKLNNVHIFPQTFADDDEMKNYDEDQAMLKCQTYASSESPCVGIVKSDEKYHYLFSNIQNQLPINEARGQLYRKLISSSGDVDYIKVNNIFNARTITKGGSNRIEGFENISDRISSDTEEQAKTMCNNYGDRCIGFYKSGQTGKYYFLEKGLEEIEAKNKISKMFKSKERYDTFNSNYLSKSTTDATLVSGLNDSWTKVSDNLVNYKNEEDVADGVVMDGNLEGDISKFGTALEDCYNSNFPTDSDDTSRKCVGLLIEKTANENESKYHFLRFKNSNDDDSVKTNRFVLSSSDKYTKFYPRKTLYDSGQYIGKISIMDSISNEIDKDGSNDKEGGAIKLIREFNEDLTNAQVNDIEVTLSNYLTKSKGYLTNSNVYGKSVYNFMSDLKTAANSVDSDKVKDLFGTTDYNNDTQRDAFIEKVEKHYLKMYLLKHYFQHLKFFREKRIQLNTQKSELRKSYEDNNDISQIDEYDIDEITSMGESGDYFDRKRLYHKSNLPNIAAGYFNEYIKKIIKTDITDVITENKKFKVSNWVKGVHDEIQNIVKLPIISMSIKCGGAFNWENMRYATVDYKDFKYEGLDGKCYTSYNNLDPATAGGWASCDIDSGCLNDGGKSYLDGKRMSAAGGAGIIDEVIYFSNYYFYNQNRGSSIGNNLIQQYTERSADFNNTPPEITYNSEINLEVGEKEDIDLTATDNENSLEELGWKATSNDTAIVTVTNVATREGPTKRIWGDKIGTTTVKVTATDSRGASSSKELTVNVRPKQPSVIWPSSTSNDAELIVKYPEGSSDERVARKYSLQYSTNGGKNWIEPTGVRMQRNGKGPGKYNWRWFNLPDGIYKANDIHIQVKKNGVWSKSKTNLSQIIIDTKKPEITLVGDSPFNVERGSAYGEPGARLKDTSDGPAIISYVDSNQNEIKIQDIGNKVGTYTAKYNATDKANNKATQVTRTIKVRDTVKPVINIEDHPPIVGNQTDNLTIVVHTDEGGTFGTNLPTTHPLKHQAIKSVSPTPVDKEGSYTITFNPLPENRTMANYNVWITDSEGNRSLNAPIADFYIDTNTPDLQIIENDSAPVPLIITLGNTGFKYPNPGATSSDGTITNPKGDTTKVNVNKLGVYSITYEAEDDAGNKAKNERVVHVVPPSPTVTFPVITGSDGKHTKNKTITIVGKYNKEISLDGGRNWFPWKGSGNSKESTETYNLSDGTYKVNDIQVRAVENTMATTVTKLISWVRKNPSEFIVDTIGPIVELKDFLDADGVATAGVVDGTLKQGDTYNEAGAVVTGGNLKTTKHYNKDTNAFVELNDITKNIGKYKAVYEATDIAGNVTKKERTIIVEGRVEGAGEPFSNYKLDKYVSNDIFSDLKNIFNRKYYD